MNLLTNPGFNAGYHHQDNVSELAVPDGWRLYYVDNDTFPGCGTPPAYRPESVVWDIEDAPEHEKDLFFLDGNYCLKVFKAHAPVYFALTQEITGLTPGARYRFAAQVYPDIVMGYEGGRKVRPQDPWHAEARVGWSAPDTPWPKAQDGDVDWERWFNVSHNNFVYGQYNEVWQEFTAPDDGAVRVWLECKAKWGGGENNWFMDAFTLTLLDPATPQPQPQPQPEPQPEPQSQPQPQTRGAPRVQYERVYVLLPASLPQEMVLAAARVVHEAGVTLGFAADDAGVGDLDRRRVVCVSPDQIGDGLDQDWYDRYYPGVEFTAVYARNPSDLEQKLRVELGSRE